MSPVGAASAPRLVWEVSELGQSLLTVLFPHLAGLRVHQVEDIGDAVVISASGRADGVSVRYRRRSTPLLAMLAGFGLELPGRCPVGWLAPWASPCTRRLFNENPWMPPGIEQPPDNRYRAATG